MIGNLKKTIFGITLALVFLFSSVQFASAATTETVELGYDYIPGTNMNYRFYIGADGSYVYAFENNDVGIDNYESMLANYASGTVQFTFDTGILHEGSINNIESLKCDGGYVRFMPRVDYQLVYTNHSFDSYIASVVSVRPYLLLNGEKRPMTSWAENQIYIDSVTDNGVYLYIGYDVDLIVSYDDVAYTLEDLKTYFGTITLNISSEESRADLVGFKYISTGEQGVIDSINESTTNTATWLGTIWEDLSYHFPIIETTLTNIKDYTRNTYVWLDEKFPVLTQSILAFHTDVNNALATTNSHLDFIKTRFNITLTSMRDSIESYIVNARKAITGSIEEFQNNLSTQLSSWQTELDGQLTAILDILANGYNTKDSDNISGEFGGAVGDISGATDSFTDVAVEGLNNYTIPSDGIAAYGFKMIEGAQIVSAMLQSIYDSSGAFKYIVSVGFTITISAMLLGLFRFFRE